MARTQYRLDFTEGGYEENTDLQYLKDLRDDGRPGVISEYSVTWRVDNDPITQIFETSEAAEERLGQLSGMYFIEPIKTYVSPQSPDLNT